MHCREAVVSQDNGLIGLEHVAKRGDGFECPLAYSELLKSAFKRAFAQAVCCMLHLRLWRAVLFRTLLL